MYVDDFAYKPTEDEREKAANSYLMSLIAIMIGLPLPIFNLIATMLFYVANRKASPFVKWHCTQALLSQFVMFAINSIGFAWFIRIIYYGADMNNQFIAYIITALVFNIVEFIITIYSAVNVRKGKHVVWLFFGAATDELVDQSRK